ncbi:putative transcriptional regulator [Bernardetia litoralis DSM 6794]|uniref:Putative transcriptional regulator n=1 Tax=Bernardetia litoralis (strain ATCC 23117 / DSM 6794 / NBRC 15988 / NCIMB 1366 / Fx l1 / Sio-4) TaxID=880071 RepID=I4AK72_BERLS|nr:two-component regulator propeller domain-containing protein [Bernardetia litoralis]AFM04357.1 putative transcriptional regulator [Bernardetia litoralis DSM 6794]
MKSLINRLNNLTNSFIYKNLILFSLLTTIYFTFSLQNLLIAQNENNIALGEWRTHLTYFDAQTLATSPEKVYVASQNGLFFYDREFSNLEVISRIDGLSDIGISYLQYLPNIEQLLIAYKNGNIDFLSDNEIKNFPVFFEDAAILDKQIYHIYYLQNVVWISTNAGILEIDVESETNKRIRNSYQNLGENGEIIKVFATTIQDNIIYAATEKGVRYTSLNASINKNDFRNWQTIPSTQNKVIESIGSSNSTVFFAIQNEGIFSYNGITSNRVSQIPITSVYDISENRTNLTGVFISSETGIYQIEGTNSSFQVNKIENDLIKAPRQAISENGILWIADNRTGLITNNSSNFVSLFPSGTYSQNTWGFIQAKEKIIAFSGGYTEPFTPLNRTTGFYVFEDGEWINYNAENRDITSKPIPNVRDLVGATYSETENRVYFASLQDGILVWNLADDTFSVFDSTNSPLPHNRIIDVETDNLGNLWVALSGSNLREDAYMRKQPNDDNSSSWKGFRFNQTRTTFPLSLEIDENNTIWARLSRFVQGGILVFNEDEENTILIESVNSGNLASNDVTALKSDQNGVMWIGTPAEVSASVRTFSDIFGLFNGQDLNARDVFFESRQLLRDETITTISLDGGNRKWFGTTNGAWLFAEDASKQFLHFTVENSPLFSNQILDIEVQDKTGEVFFATPNGIISYRGTSTAAKTDFSNVKIFPNPVRPEFNGVVAIEGLTQDANVKITDISGRLVYETDSFGGTATWNGTDYNNTKSKSGVYLVYVSNQDGTEGFVGKIVFIE